MNEIITGDCLTVLRTLPSESVQVCVTSPPYYSARNYGMDLQIGLEETPQEYIAKLVKVFREVRRVLRADGTLWLNIADIYGHGTRAKRQDSPNSTIGTKTAHAQNGVIRNGLPAKQLMMIPARVAIALQEDGWILRADAIWHKTNAQPEPQVSDRPTRSHEYVFLFSKSLHYFYDHTEPSSSRSVWSMPTEAHQEAHDAIMPQKLASSCILAGSRPGDTVLDPFAGFGTVLLVASQLGRDWLGVELNPAYVQLTLKRIETLQVNLWEAAS